MDELVAIGRARKLVERIMSPPVDVEALIAAHGMVFKESDRLEPGEAGNTVTKGGTTYIVVNKNDDPFRRRFTALHELAHNVLQLPSKHGSGVPSNELERFASRPQEERICDVFAAECLVPSHLVRPLVATSSFSMDFLLELSDKFQASKQCVASCYVRNSKDLVAYVYAEGGKVHHVLPSSALRDAKLFVDYGMLPGESAAAIAISSKVRSAVAELDASDWSASDAALCYACYEEAVYVTTWDETHSLLTFEQVSKSDRSIVVDSDEDELLPEMTGHLSWNR
jgi:Zn-dependent peptidase ImmA (M78 family)